MSTIVQLSQDLQATREQLNVALANGEDTAPRAPGRARGHRQSNPC